MDNLTVPELKDILRNAGVPGYSNKRKHELIDMIIANGLTHKINIRSNININVNPIGTPRIVVPVIPQIQPIIPQARVPPIVPAVPQIQPPRVVPQIQPPRVVPQIQPSQVQQPRIIPQIQPLQIAPQIQPVAPQIVQAPRIIPQVQPSQIAPQVQPPQTVSQVPPLPTGPPPKLPSQPAPSVSPRSLGQQKRYNLKIPGVPDKIDYTLPFQLDREPSVNGYPNLPGSTEELTRKTLAGLRPL